MLNRRKGNPDKLKKINQERRRKTLASIRNAVDELNSMGFLPSITKIMEITSLSRGTFALDHIIELLKELKIGKYGKINIDKEITEINIDDYIEIQKELNKKEKQLTYSP